MTLWELLPTHEQHAIRKSIKPVPLWRDPVFWEPVLAPLMVAILLVGAFLIGYGIGVLPR